MLEQNAIFRPMAALVGLTFLVLLVIPFRRVRAGVAGKVTPDDFKLGESATVPDDVRIPNRNLMNLLEMPVLFYVACLTLFVTSRVDNVAIECAWTFVGLRVLHSIVHLTYNKVVHRLTLYAAANVALASMWIHWMIGQL